MTHDAADRTAHFRRVPRTSRRVIVVAAAFIGVLAVAGCSGASQHASAPTHGGAAAAGAASDSAAAAARDSAAAAVPATISATPRSGSKNVNPTAPISVRISGGSFTSVIMTNAAGKRVTGALAAGHASWHATEDLGYGRTYRIVASGTNADGVSVTSRSSFTTLNPANQTAVTLQRIGHYSLQDGATYGVGIVPVVHFDTAITSKADKAAALRALTVTTSPHVAGAWAWYGDSDVHFRPRSYWAPGTKVTIAAHVYGAKLGDGLYGQSDVSSSFTIGRKQITVAEDNAPKGVDKVRVYRNGTLVRTMNTSMGMHSGTTSGGNYIDFHTMNGTYTVLEHDNPAIMSSASYGLSPNDPGGYAPEPIYYSTKISTDGIYLHYLDTIYAQDNGVDVSHGCLNLNHPNAVWFFDHSMIGDPVEISHTDGPTIDVQQGGDWSVPWKVWTTGRITEN